MLLNDCAQSILSKLNQIIDKLNMPSTAGDAKESSVQSAITQATNANTNASNASSYANSAKSNTATNNTASSTGILSQKLSYIINQLGTISTNINNSIEKTFVATPSDNVLKTLLSGSQTANTGTYSEVASFRVSGFSGTLRILCSHSGSGNDAVYVNGALIIYASNANNSMDFYVNDGDAVIIKTRGQTITWDSGNQSHQKGTISNVRLCGTITEIPKTYNWDIIIT